jgi:hypothetical protein
MNTCNVIAANWLAKRCLERTMALPSSGSVLQTRVPEVGPAIQIIKKLRATLESRVPVGYEDETGFHYGADVTDCSFKV